MRDPKAIQELETKLSRDREILADRRKREAQLLQNIPGKGFQVEAMRRRLVCEMQALRMFGWVRWHWLVRHDGPVSFRRAFRKEDWVLLLAAAEVPREAVSRSKSQVRISVSVCDSYHRPERDIRF